MRKVSYFVAASLDGYIARLDGGIDWLFSDGDYGYDAFYSSVDAVVMGRKTFEVSLSFGNYPYKGKRAVVFSKKGFKTELSDVEVTAEDPSGVVRRLKGEPGSTIWFIGGAVLAKPLFAADLIDEVVASIHPVTLGEGIPLFPPGIPGRPWKLIDSEEFPTGLLQLTYRRGRQ